MASRVGLFWSAVGLGGVSSAVGVPLSLSTQNSSFRGGAPSRSIVVIKCSDSSQTVGSSVAFGDRNVQNVCWSVDHSSSILQDSKYSKLFADNWSTSTWSDTSQWRSQCTNGATYQFVITTTDSRNSKPKYLGLCDSTTTSISSQWVSAKKDGQSSDNLTIQACSGTDCWQAGSSGSSDIQNLTNPQTNKWWTVTFKKMS